MFTMLITKENQKLFDMYIPVQARDDFDIAIGAVIHKTGETGETAGVILAQAEDNRLEITWIYVGAAFRRQGIGTALINRLKSCADFEPTLSGVFLQFPADTAEALESLLLKENFTVEDGESSVYNLTVADMSSNPFWKKKPPLVENIVPLSDVFDVSLREFEVSAAGRGVMINPINRCEYDPALSMVYVKDKKIAGALLIERDGADIVLSRVYVNPDTAAAMAAMLYKAGSAVIAALPPEAKVSLAAVTDASVRLTQKLFPSLKTPPVKNAYFIFNSQDKEAAQ
jgi:GNAT superfamily N-acetyltransferase